MMKSRLAPTLQLGGAPGPQHREMWLRDPDGYVVVIAGPDGESSS